jgi:hypothetical protein
MGDPFWLNVTNIGLGVVILVCVGVIAIGITKDVLAKRARRLAAHGEMQEMASDGGNLFAVPGLGLTMADGGEQAAPKAKGKKARK